MHQISPQEEQVNTLNLTNEIFPVAYEKIRGEQLKDKCIQQLKNQEPFKIQLFNDVDIITNENDCIVINQKLFHLIVP